MGCCMHVSLFVMPVTAAIILLISRVVTKEKSYPEFQLDNLKHPVYSTAFLNLQTGLLEADYTTNLRQQQEYESFMQFANYTNTFR